METSFQTRIFLTGFGRPWFAAGAGKNRAANG